MQPQTRGVKCIVEQDGKFLLIRIAYAHKQWTFPGGKVDKKESFQEAAFRELREESGIQPTELVLFGEYESRREYKHDTIQCFYGQTRSAEIKLDPLEVAEAGWFLRQEFPTNRSDRVDSIMQLYDDWRKS